MAMNGNLREHDRYLADGVVDRGLAVGIVRQTRAALFALVLAASSLAHADAPQLAEARIAIDEVRYDDAQRLLISALEAGGNSPAGVREIYKLLGASAVAMGQGDEAQKYYRAWIELDTKAALDAGASPKLREQFDAAKSYIVANGGVLAVTALTFTGDEVNVFVNTDAIGIAVAARMVGSTEATNLDQNRQSIMKGRGSVVVLDRYGNTLIDPVVPEPREDPNAPYIRDQPRPEPPPKRTLGTGFYALAVPAGVLLATGIGFGAASIIYKAKVQAAVDDSGSNFYTDVADRQKKVTLFWKLSAVIGGAGLVLAIPTTILYLRSRATVAPYADAQSAGVAIAGRF
jgi:hypothetical protein